MLLHCKKPVPGVQIVGKGTKNRATAQRTASEKDAEKWTDTRFFTRFPKSRLPPLSERLEQATLKLFAVVCCFDSEGTTD